MDECVNGRWAALSRWGLAVGTALTFWLAPIVVVKAGCDAPDAVWLSLEIVAPLAGTDEAAEWIEVTRDGCLTVRYAKFYRHAGLYQRDLTANELANLSGVVRAGDFAQADTATIKRQIVAAETTRSQASGRDTHFVVADGDIYRLRIDDSGKVVQLHTEAPRQFAAQFPEVVALKGLLGLVDALQSAAADPARRTITPVQP